MIHVVIPGDPHSQMRARSRVIRTKSGKAFATHYDPPESRSWKAYAQGIMERALDAAEDSGVLPSEGTALPFAGPVRVRIVAWFACPKSDERKTMPRPVRWSENRKDCDNVAKAVLDAATGVFWADDCIVARLEVTKLIAKQGEPARTEVIVEALPPEPIFGAQGEFIPKLTLAHT